MEKIQCTIRISDNSALKAQMEKHRENGFIFDTSLYTVQHENREAVTHQYALVTEGGRGRKSKEEIVAIDFIETANAWLIEQAKAAIESQIKAEADAIAQERADAQEAIKSLTERANELEGQNSTLSQKAEQLEELKIQLAEQLAKMAELEKIRQEQEAEKAEREKKEAEAKKELEAKEAKIKAFEEEKELAESKFVKNKGIATKFAMKVTLVIGALFSVVMFSMNLHNITELFGGIFPSWARFIFSLMLAFMPWVFAYLKDEIEVKASVTAIGIDFVIAILLSLFPLEELKEKQWILYIAMMLLSGALYGYLLYIVGDKLYKIMYKKKYEEFFNSLFK